MPGIKNRNIYQQRVSYSVVDRMGFLYHVAYLEYFELARSDWVRKIYKPYKEIEDEGYALVVIEANLKYHKPAYYDDVLEIAASVSNWGNSRLSFNYEVYRENENKPLCTGVTKHCFINKDGKPAPMPEGLKTILEKLES